MSKSSGSLWITAGAAFAFLVGYGIALHDFAHQVWQLKGTPISLEGGYIGFALMAPIAIGSLFVALTSAKFMLDQRRARRSADETHEWFYPSKEHEGT
jgi:hypothetical protein